MFRGLASIDGGRMRMQIVKCLLMDDGRLEVGSKQRTYQRRSLSRPQIIQLRGTVSAIYRPMMV